MRGTSVVYTKLTRLAEYTPRAMRHEASKMNTDSLVQRDKSVCFPPVITLEPWSKKMQTHPVRFHHRALRCSVL